MKRKRSLSRFETLAQQLVEGSFKRLFGEQLEAYEVAARLARTLEDSQADGRAADLYTVQLHPDDLAALLAKNPDLAKELAAYLMKLAQQAGLLLPTLPQVLLAADTDVSRHQMRALAEHNSPHEEQTTQVHTLAALGAPALAALQERDAFLIVAGRQHVPLDRPILTIGRRTDNDIVLDSATVSRQHAQIRWRYGRFIVYDLSRRDRTAVNDQPITEHALQPGDVIALSDTLLIYGEGRDEIERVREPVPDDESQTLQLPKQD